MKKKKYQFVNWFPKWKGFWRMGKWTGSMGYVYEWSIHLGFWEIRKWQQKSFDEINKSNHK
jgi:hypothetical protein